jgi:hypothetical protein
METTETATATIPTEASATSEAPATLLAAATSETGNTQQTPIAQTQEPTSTETAAAEATTTESETAAGVPEKYIFTAPEGKEYDPGVLESFSGAAKEAGLTQDAAQKLIDQMAPVLATRQADQVKAIQTEWLNASQADKEFGGEKLAENLGVARKALDTFGTPELRKLLDDTGMGSHPEVIRMLYRAGKAMSEDTFVAGSHAVSVNRTLGETLYGKNS